MASFLVVYSPSRTGSASHRRAVDEFLLEMKKTVKKVQKLLRDSEKTAFVGVTIPEAIAVAETKDLVRDLKRMKSPLNTLSSIRLSQKGNYLFYKKGDLCRNVI